jgi:hypothetical protein
MANIYSPRVVKRLAKVALFLNIYWDDAEAFVEILRNVVKPKYNIGKTFVGLEDKQRYTNYKIEARKLHT